MCLSLFSQKWNQCLVLLFMGALLPQLFCFPTSPGHSFLTPDFSFSSLCSPGAHILAPWVSDTTTSALPSCSPSSPALKLCWHDPGILVPLPLTKTALLSFSFSICTKGGPSRALQWCPSHFSQLLHQNFNLLKNIQCPGGWQHGCSGKGSGLSQYQCKLSVGCWM